MNGWRKSTIVKHHTLVDQRMTVVDIQRLTEDHITGVNLPGLISVATLCWAEKRMHWGNPIRAKMQGSYQMGILARIIDLKTGSAHVFGRETF